MTRSVHVVVRRGNRQVGMHLPQHETDHVQGLIYTRQRFYEDDLLEHMATLLSPDDLFVDVGAYIGNHSLFAASMCDARVVSLEPNPESFEVLQANVKLNGLTERVSLSNTAAGRVASTATLLTPDLRNRGDTRVTIAERGSVVVVPIDDLELPGPPKVIKIDVQGMELDVLEGATRTILQHRPILYIENKSSAELSRLLALLEGWEYSGIGQFGATPNLFCVPRGHALATVPAQLGMLHHSLHSNFAGHGARLRSVAETQKALGARIIEAIDNLEGRLQVDGSRDSGYALGKLEATLDGVRDQVLTAVRNSVEEVNRGTQQSLSEIPETLRSHLATIETEVARLKEEVRGLSEEWRQRDRASTQSMEEQLRTIDGLREALDPVLSRALSGEAPRVEAALVDQSRQLRRLEGEIVGLTHHVKSNRVRHQNGISDAPPDGRPPARSTQNGAQPSPSFQRKLAKLRRDPARFFSDARAPILKGPVGQALSALVRSLSSPRN